MERQNDLSRWPLPLLTAEEVERLDHGEVIKTIERLPSGSGRRRIVRIVAYQLIEAPRDRVWLASLDPHLRTDTRLRQVELERDSEGGGLELGAAELPWPLQDRLWLIRYQAETGIARQTEGMIWERSWQLVDGGEQTARELAAAIDLDHVAADLVESAAYLPQHSGAWTVFAVESRRTLLAYQVTIPTGLAARLARLSLDVIMQRVAAGAADIPEHYTDAHPVLFGGDGLPLLPPIGRGPGPSGEDPVSTSPNSSTPDDLLSAPQIVRPPLSKIGGPREHN